MKGVNALCYHKQQKAEQTWNELNQEENDSVQNKARKTSAKSDDLRYSGADQIYGQEAPDNE